MILIAGGGVAGLSAAYHLQRAGLPYLLVEKERDVGGLCRSIRKRGYIFDYSGHLLCAHSAESRDWIIALLDGELLRAERRAAIYMDGRYIPYPFQAHLGALPFEAMAECMIGYLRELWRPGLHRKTEDLETWIQRNFGRGMARRFFIPYNRKLWGIPLKSLCPDGLEWSIPRPRPFQVILGGFGLSARGMGYNSQFLYPSRGGIEEIPRALSRDLSNVRVGCEIARVEWKRRVAHLNGGETVSYDRLISSIPLPNLLKRLEPPPGWIARAAESLRWVSLWILNIGVRRENVCGHHWVYFPEREFPFHRVGCYTAFGPHLAPKGRSALYVEIPAHRIRDPEDGRWIDECLEGLVRCGILRGLDEVELADPVRIPIGYVIHDRERLRVLPEIESFLTENRIRPVGRYGTWGYGTMEQAISQGRETAECLFG